MWGLKGCDCVDPDHMQIYVEYIPKYSMSCLSGMMKGRSSRMPWMELPHFNLIETQTGANLLNFGAIVLFNNQLRHVIFKSSAH